MKLTLLFAAAAVACVAGCGVTQPVRVLDDGRTALTASLGGPVIPAGGVAFPVPYLNAGAAYGVCPGMTASANLHLTALLFNDIGFDLGAAVRLLGQDRALPEVTAKLQGLVFATMNPGAGSALLADASLNASWLFGAHTLAYAGMEHTFQFHTPGYFFTPFLGIQFPLGGPMDAQVEAKWLAANRFTGHGVFEGGGSVNAHGNIGLYFGVMYHLGGRGQ